MAKTNRVITDKSAGGVITASDFNSVKNSVGSYVRVRRNANQSVPTATPTNISFDVENVDEDSIGYWTNAQPSRLTAPEAGVYIIAATVPMPANGSAYFGQIRILYNTNAYGNQSSNDCRDIILTATAILQLSAGEYVEVNVRQDTGSNQNFVNVLCCMTRTG